MKPETQKEVLMLMGLAPFAPPPQFDPQVTVQEEFRTGTDERFVQDWLEEHHSPWRLAMINDQMHYMLVYRQAQPADMQVWGF